MRLKLVTALIVVLALVWYFSNSSSNNAEPSYQTPTTASEPTTEPTAKAPTTKPVSTVSSTSNQASLGRIIFGVTDKAVNLDTIQSINMTVTSASIHSPKSGWKVVSQTPMQFDLLKLKAAPRTELLADIGIPEDSYDSIRLTIGDITVANKNGTISQAKLPSNSLQINSNVKVMKGKVSSVQLDFLADKSMHQTGDGKIIFAPVIAIETKSETTLQQSVIQGSTNKKVEFLGGNTNYSATIGMDINGVTRVNDSIDPSANLEIVGDSIRIIPKQ